MRREGHNWDGEAVGDGDTGKVVAVVTEGEMRLVGFLGSGKPRASLICLGLCSYLTLLYKN